MCRLVTNHGYANTRGEHYLVPNQTLGRAEQILKVGMKAEATLLTIP
jgi:hypothetical protein